MKSPKYPVLWQTRGECGTCGFAIPSHYLVMSRKHGWQCLPGNGVSRGCWDGDFDRDDIYFVYPDNEGTRDTAAPLADQGTPMQFNIYVLRDSVTGILYAIDFTAPPYVLVQIALADVDPDIYNGPFDWLEGSNGQRIYVANDALTTGLFSAIYCPSAPGAVQVIPTFAAAPGDVTVEEPTGCAVTIPDMSNIFLAGDPFAPPQPPGVCYRENSGGTVISTPTSWANGVPGTTFDNNEITCKTFGDFYCPQTLSPCTQIILDVDIDCPGVGQRCTMRLVSMTANPVLQADGTWGALPITGPFTGHITSLPLVIADPVTGIGLSCSMSFNISGPPFNPVVVSNPIVTVLP